MTSVYYKKAYSTVQPTVYFALKFKRIFNKWHTDTNKTVIADVRTFCQRTQTFTSSYDCVRFNAPAIICSTTSYSIRKFNKSSRDEKLLYRSLLYYCWLNTKSYEKIYAIWETVIGERSQFSQTAQPKGEAAAWYAYSWIRACKDSLSVAQNGGSLLPFTPRADAAVL